MIKNQPKLCLWVKIYSFSSENAYFGVKIRLKTPQKRCCILLDTLVSGSPLLQNGKLIGAVTHVLVDDPTKGYAIFAENMLETAQSVAEGQQLKEAS